MQGAVLLKDFLESHFETNLMRLYVTQDETWVLFNDIKPKEENKVWAPPGQPRPQIVRPQQTWQKTMLLVAFTGNKKFSIDVMQKSETVDLEQYVEFVHSTGEKWRKLHSDPIHLNNVWWQHDNARPHTSAVTEGFFSQ